MAVDNEFISRNSFNTKFKNYLRDIYVYQFKNKDFDFYDTGNFSRSRLVAALIACKLCNGIDIFDFYNVKMKDIEFSDDCYVSVTFTQKKDKNSESEAGVTVRLGKPWSEMFGYLYISKPSFYFLTGTKGSFQNNKTSVNSIDDEENLFQKGCPSPITTYKMYRYWSEIYLREANENIASSTYDNDFKRLKNLVGKMTGVEWTVNSQSPDYNSGEVTDNNNDWVECVTADTRDMSKNPFHSLYRYCNRYSKDTDYFNILFALFMYFNLDKKVSYGETVKIQLGQIGETTYRGDFQRLASDLYTRLGRKYWNKLDSLTKLQIASWFISELTKVNTTSLNVNLKKKYCDNRSTNNDTESSGSEDSVNIPDNSNLPKLYSCVLELFRSTTVDPNSFDEGFAEEPETDIPAEDSESEGDDSEYYCDYSGKKVREAKNYCENSFEAEARKYKSKLRRFRNVFAYLITDKKRLMFNGQDFLLVDSEYVEMSMLYAALSRFLNCGKKQFTNIIGDIFKTGAFRESNRISVVYDPNEDKCVKYIKNILNNGFHGKYTVKTTDWGLYSVNCSKRISKDGICDFISKISSIAEDCNEEHLCFSSGKIKLHYNRSFNEKVSEIVKSYDEYFKSEINEYPNFEKHDSEIKNKSKSEKLICVLSLSKDSFKIEQGEDPNKLTKMFKKLITEKVDFEVTAAEWRFKYKHSYKEKIENVLNSYGNCFDLVEEVKGYSYHIYYSKDIDKSDSDKLEKLLASEIGLEVFRSSAVYVSMSDCNLKDVLSSVEGNKGDNLIQRFSEMVSFFSQTSVLGEIGSYVADRLPAPTWKILYKHNYIVKALNDYNNIDLLYAMQNPDSNNHYWVEIGARDSLDKHGYLYFICYPIQIRENVTDGKQYLIYYHPKYRSIDSIRVDFIDSVIVGSRAKNPDFDEDIKRAYKLIDKTWGLDFCDFYEGNVKSEPHPSKVTFTISFARKKDKNTNEFEIEKFIESRIRREVENYVKKKKSEKDFNDSLLEMTVEVVNPWAMLSWIRSYTRRIDGVKIEYVSYMDDIVRADNMYSSMKKISGGNGNILSTAEPVDISLLGGGNKMISISDSDFTPVESKSDLLFNEFYCKSFGKLGEMMKSILKEDDESKKYGYKINSVDEILSKIAKEKKDKSYQRNIYRKFLEKFRYNGYKENLNKADKNTADNKYDPYFSLLENVKISSVYDLIPLTHIEIQWILNILDHNQARGFLTKDEIDAIKAKLPEMSVFNVNSVVLQDKHSDKKLEEYYKKTQNGECALMSKDGVCALDFSSIVSSMMGAINGGKTVKIKYRTQYGTDEEHTINPYGIEYSKRDNRFRALAFCWEKLAKEKGSEKEELFTVGRVYTYPIDGILNFDEDISAEAKSQLIQKVVKKYQDDKVGGFEAFEGTIDISAEMLVENAIRSYNKENKKTIVVFFPDINGIPDRILTEFSCYKKTCIKWGNGTYRMTLEYLKEDCMEIVIRLLGYGSLITVKSEDSGDPVVNELMKRYHEQVELYREEYRYIEGIEIAQKENNGLNKGKTQTKNQDGKTQDEEDRGGI